jgi:diguanylate cyclase (GGDEF)-like protein
MSESSYPGMIEPLRDRAWGRGAVVAAVLVVGVLVAVAIAAWSVALTLDAGELDRADARLASEVRGAAAGISARVAVADAAAGSLAASPRVQRALLSGNRSALRDVLNGRSNLTFYRGDTLLAGRQPGASITRSVRIIARGRAVGRVVASIPLQPSLLRSLEREAGTRAPDRLRLEVGAAAANVPVARGFDAEYQGRAFRFFAARVVGPPQQVVLEAATPRGTIGKGTGRRTLWLTLATLVSLITLAVAVRGLYLLWGERLRTRPRRRDVRQVLGLVGDALASTHDPDRLLPVILHAAMEATGASAGVAIRDGEEIAREGTFERTGEPLRLGLGSADVAGEELALILHPDPNGFDERTISLAQSLVAQAGVALDNARLHGIVKRQAVTDELTGLANRRSFLESLETEFLRAERFQDVLAVVVSDLDDFKRVNDRFGHQAGDAVLRAFAEVMGGRIRAIDVGARLGGEEFAILLPGTDAAGATALAENLRAAAAELPISIGHRDVQVTASFGVAAFPQAKTADELMVAADRALYAAKREGKNRVVAFGTATGR